MLTASDVARFLQHLGIEPAPAAEWMAAGWPPGLPRRSSGPFLSPADALAVLRLAAAGMNAFKAMNWIGERRGPPAVQLDLVGPVVEPMAFGVFVAQALEVPHRSRLH